MYVNNLYLPKSNTMKSLSKVFAFLLLAALPFSLFAQNPVVVLGYMKVEQGKVGDYLKIEQDWKKIHQKKMEAGMITGWQLFRNLYAGAEDPYQYIAVNWYQNYEKSFEEVWPDGLLDDVFSEEEWEEVWEMTLKSRKMAFIEVSHQVVTDDSNEPAKYILVNRMKVKPGMESAYVEMERDIYKPIHEELIKRGLMSHWGLWITWPFKEGQARYTTVDGYRDLAQLTAGGEDVLSSVHPDMTWDELNEKIMKLREVVSTELWELVDFVFPEEE